MSSPSADVLFDRDDSGRLIALVPSGANQAREALARAGFQPGGDDCTYVAPREIGPAQARQLLQRARRSLRAQGLTTLTDAAVDEWPHDTGDDLTTAPQAVDDLARRLGEMWHPDEVAGHLHHVAGSGDSLLAAIRHLLDRARIWCGDSHPSAASALADATAAVDQARRRINDADAHLHRRTARQRTPDHDRAPRHDTTGGPPAPPRGVGQPPSASPPPPPGQQPRPPAP